MDNTQPLVVVHERHYFKPFEVIRFTGATYRQLDYWNKTGMISPYRTSSNLRRYNWRDFFLVYTVMTLNRAGVSIQALRGIIPAIRSRLNAKSDESVLDTTLVVSQSMDRVLMCRGAVLSVGESSIVDIIVSFNDIVEQVNAFDLGQAKRRAQKRIDRIVADKLGVSRETPYTEALKTLGHPIAVGGAE